VKRSIRSASAFALIVLGTACAEGGAINPDDGSGDSVGGADTTGATSGGGKGSATSGGTGAGDSTGTGETTGAGAGSSTGAGAGDPGPGPGPGGPTAVDCTHVGQGTDYQVGPGKAYENLGDVPFESLVAGDTVRVFYRPEAYHEKLMISGQGTAEQPIRICGVAGPNGELPVLDGANATTRPSLVFPYSGHQMRGVVVVGHPNSDPWLEQPQHVVIEALEITNASPENSFTNVSGLEMTYLPVAAGIYVQRADHVTVRGCIVHDNNNGLFIGGGSGDELTEHVLIEGNHIYQNGSLSDYYHHNVYNEAVDITYQFNRFGEPRAGTQGVLGANIKERSAGVVIRYNWIEDGAHLLDVVDAQEAASDTLGLSSFHETYVYGNVMIRNGASGSMIHYGGDSGILEDYRKGTLHFYENTLIVNNESLGDWDSVDVFELSTNDEELLATNNIFYSSAQPGSVSPVNMLGERDSVVAGIATFANNWVRDGWSPMGGFGGATEIAQIVGLTTSMGGANPGFVDAANESFAPTSGAMVVGAGTDMSAMIPAELGVSQEYVPHQGGKARAPESPPTLGAMASAP
jgi:parallel beta-helix repeat protein